MSAMLSSERVVLLRKPLSRIPLQARTRSSKKIYFVLCDLTHRVKCGIAVDPIKRLSGLQTGSPTPLRIIGILDGDEAQEKAIHRRLTRFRAHGEWFEYEPHVRDVIIEEMTAHVQDRCHGLYIARTQLESQLPPAHFPP